MNKTDLLILLVGFLAGLSGTLLLFLFGGLAVKKREEQAVERFYLEIQGEHQRVPPGFVHSQRHTAWDQ